MPSPRKPPPPIPQTATNLIFFRHSRENSAPVFEGGRGMSVPGLNGLNCPGGGNPAAPRAQTAAIPR